MNAERLSNILNGKNYIFGGKNCRKVKLSHPLFSIITPVKNDVLNIEKTIQSVLQQKYKNFQYIIVDGNSDDGTLDVIKKYNNKIDFWVSYDDKNLWEAINTGIKLSTGHIIGIINSKDIYYKNALKIVKKYFLNFKIDFLFGAVKKNKVYYLYEPKKISYRFNIYPAHSIGFFNKKKTQYKVGFYDESLAYCSDYDLFYRIIKEKKFKGMPTNKKEVLGKFDLTGMSSSLSFLHQLYYEMLVRLKNKQNIFFLLFLIIARIFHKIINYKKVVKIY
jgi:glycosyltransferase involved in cell wall biosynthesis